MARKNIKTRARKKRADELVKNNQWNEALELYQEIARIDPLDTEAWLRLGVIYGSFTMRAESEECLRKALALEPDNISAMINLAGALELQNRNEEALEILEKVHEQKPGMTRPISTMANLHEKLGNYDTAYRLIQPFVSSSTPDLNAALCYGRLCTRVGDSSEAAAYISLVLNDRNCEPGDRITLLFVLGQLYDARGEYDTAFRYYQMANQGNAASYDPKQHEQSIGAVIEAFTRESMQAMPHGADHTVKPVFIVGMPRSGTSLVEQILACHSQVAGAGEIVDLNEVMNTLTSRTGHRNILYIHELDKLGPDNIDSAARRYLDALDGYSADTSIVTNKLPDNYQALGLIQLMFPGARIIHCMRNPVDTCLSCYFQNFRGWHPYSYDLANLAKHYTQYTRIMAHWRQELDIPMYEVQYENLVENQEQVSREMIDFLGLEWEQQCLRFHKSKRLTVTASYDQVRRPIYRKSVARWRNYEKHLGPLLEILRDPDDDVAQTGSLP